MLLILNMNLKITVNYKIPSLNRLFAMSHWQRKDERHKAHYALWCALSPTEASFSTQTTSAQSLLLMGYGTLGSYLATGPKTLSTRCARKNADRKKSAPKSN